MYNWEVKNCQIIDFRPSEKYDSSGKFVFNSPKGSIPIPFKIPAKFLTDFISVHKGAFFDAKGDVELRQFNNDSPPYAARILREIDVSRHVNQGSTLEEEEDEIPF